MNLISIIGARPQFIKYFPISRAIKKHNQSGKGKITDILVHTGQHYDYNMSRIFFDEFGIKEPDYHLEVGSDSHGRQTGEVMMRTEEVLLKEKPDMVMVYGDTNSTLGGALASSKLHIPVAHVEAGLRSFNKKMPEEINRILTDHISSLLFCPSKLSIDNLQNEGFSNILNDGQLITKNDIDGIKSEFLSCTIDNPWIINCGDVMFDVFLFAQEIAQKKSDIMNRLQLKDEDFVLLTLHRAENTDHPKRFQEIVQFINKTVKNRRVIFPVHPRTRKLIEKHGSELAEYIQMIDPVSYFDLVRLLEECTLVMTDSGGLQKEAYWAAKPCITLRDETEWVETVESGWNVLYKDFRSLEDLANSENNSLYGQGQSSEIIVKLFSLI